nr:hypothetical protein [Propionibacterium sp.]
MNAVGAVSQDALLAAGLLGDLVLAAATEDQMYRALCGLASPSLLWGRLGEDAPLPEPREAWAAHLPLWHPVPLPSPEATARLAAAWRRLVAGQHHAVDAVRAEVDSPEDAALLARLEPVTGGLVSPVIAQVGLRFGWRWPLRIGVFGPSAAAWVNQINGHRHAGEQFLATEGSGEDGELEIGIIDGDAYEAANPQRWWQSLQAVGGAAAIVIAGSSPAEALLDRVRGASRIAVAIPQHDVSWWESVYADLAHDRPLDLALRRNIPGSLICGLGRVLDLTAVAHWGLEVSRRDPQFADLASLIRAATFDEEKRGARALVHHAGGQAVTEFHGAAAPTAALPSKDGEPVGSDGEPPSRDLQPASPPTSPPPEPPPIAEARRVQACIRHGQELRDTFVAGEPNVIRCWIGLPEAGAPTSDAPIPGRELPAGGIELTAELRWQGRPASGVLHLPRDRSARSDDCDLTLEVPADVRDVVAEIMFRYRGRCFESVELHAAALPVGVAPADKDRLRIRVQLSRRDVDALSDSQPCDSTLVFGRGNLGVYDGSGGRTYHLDTPAKVRDWLSNQLFATQQSLVRRRADTEGGLPVLNVEDDEVRVLIRDLARYGAGLFNQLDRREPGERFQVLSLDPDAIVPVEFVYDRGNPDEDAVLCQGWARLADLPEDAEECPACGKAPGIPPLHAKVVCPLGFWSIRKVIERFDSDMAAGGSTARPERRDLRPITSAVFACSSSVLETDREAAWATIRNQVPGAVRVENWDEWAAAVGDHPALLIALAHHGEDGFEDYLQIGPETLDADLGRLRRGMIGPEYVNPDRRDPGPILLLLGCRTGVESELGYVQLVREFEKLNASIVLGTHDQILGRHAAPVAAELVAELVAVHGAGADFGSIMRRLRRRMLGRGYLMAFGLVALGDAEWRLTPAPEPRGVPAT